MSAIRELELALTRALGVEIEPPGVTPELAQVIAELREHARIAAASRPPRDRQQEAVQYFKLNRALLNVNMARCVCFGSIERFHRSDIPLIEESSAFLRLLDLIDEYRSEPRKFRRCYRGLLHSYFGYDSERPDTPDAGKINWVRLRDYLHERRNAIRTDGIPPDWVAAIQEHPNLTTDEPVRRYAPALLNGGSEIVDYLRACLDINDDSWLMRKLIIAQIKEAVKETDSRFKSLVQSLLDLLNGHEFLENDGLGLILNRYSSMRFPELHIGLRDTAIQIWGNPWLERNSPNWSRVTPEARKLVTNWLKLDLIREFFEAMSEDRQADPRRVKFWGQYHEQIDDMYFALGSVALNARGADAKRMRHLMGDHLLTLRRAGSSSNNAFIMVLGNIVAVEFGEKGSACFFYRRDDLPFKLSGEVTGDRYGLKSADHLARLTHVDAGYEKWEEKFARALHEYGVIRLGTRNALGSQPHCARAMPRGLTKSALKEFCELHNIPWMDNTSTGGRIRIKFPYNAGSIAEQFRNWGFEFSERNDIWWRRGWE
jgi:hypothetical protein